MTITKETAIEDLEVFRMEHEANVEHALALRKQMQEVVVQADQAGVPRIAIHRFSGLNRGTVYTILRRAGRMQ